MANEDWGSKLEELYRYMEPVGTYEQHQFVITLIDVIKNLEVRLEVLENDLERRSESSDVTLSV